MFARPIYVVLQVQVSLFLSLRLSVANLESVEKRLAAVVSYQDLPAVRVVHLTPFRRAAPVRRSFSSIASVSLADRSIASQQRERRRDKKHCPGGEGGGGAVTQAYVFKLLTIQNPRGWVFDVKKSLTFTKNTISVGNTC